MEKCKKKILFVEKKRCIHSHDTCPLHCVASEKRDCSHGDSCFPLIFFFFIKRVLKPWVTRMRVIHVHEWVKILIFRSISFVFIAVLPYPPQPSKVAQYFRHIAISRRIVYGETAAEERKLQRRRISLPRIYNYLNNFTRDFPVTLIVPSFLIASALDFDLDIMHARRERSTIYSISVISPSVYSCK